MIFGLFFKTIMSTKVISGRRDEVAGNLLCASGVILKEGQNITTTVSKWIDNNVPKNITNYFPGGKVNEAETLSFFKRLINNDSKMEKVQEAFSKLNGIGDCAVDCSTKEPAEFFQSLLNQFVLSIGLIPKSMTVVTDSAAVSTVSEQMQDILDQAIEDCCMEDFIQNNPPVWLDDDLKTKARTFLETIETAIIDRFGQSCSELLMYQKIMEFCQEIKNYIAVDGLISYQFQPDDYDNRRKIIKSLYYGIFPYR